MSHVLDKPCLCEFAETARWQGLIGKEPGGKRQENHPFDQICCQSIFTSSFSVCFWRSKHARRKFKLDSLLARFFQWYKALSSIA